MKKLKKKIFIYITTLAIALIAVAILVKAIEIIASNCYASSIAAGLVITAYTCYVTEDK